jgi:2,3-bisphosphoglycerate-independent phosphoglycerate mutase
MAAARKPMMDKLAKTALVGTVSNVPTGMVPESDTANLAVLSYDPAVYSKGRSPLEAVSMGINMQPDETAYRCNIVTLSEEEDYDNKIMLDHSADEITTAEADVLVKALEEKLGNDIRRFYTGVSYRHCLIWKNGDDKYQFMRPHDILGKRIGEYLPRTEDGGAEFLELMKKSYDILKDHPVNLARKARGLKPANSAWLWSPGKKPQLPSFKQKWGLDAAVISAVDLIKGIGLCAEMQSIDVEGATGLYDTNYEGKAQAAIDALKTNDFVFLHIEASDEAGHEGDVDLKVRTIEYLDSRIVKPIFEAVKTWEEPVTIAISPDHPTPCAIKTHTNAPVPFIIYNPLQAGDPVQVYDEQAALQGAYGHISDNEFMQLLFDKK